MMQSDRNAYQALGGSLFLHAVLFLIAAMLGLFSMTAPQQRSVPIDVVLYEADKDTGSSGGGTPPAEAADTALPDEIMREDLVQQPLAEVHTVSHAPRTAMQKQKTDSASGSGSGRGSAGGGTGSGMGSASGSGSGGTGGTAAPPPPPPPPPKERIEASLRAEAMPTYPAELVDEEAEGRVTIKILVAEDGTVEAVSVVSSSGYGAMDRAAVAAGYRFQFNPGDNGRKGVWTKTFRFQLN